MVILHDLDNPEKNQLLAREVGKEGGGGGGGGKLGGGGGGTQPKKIFLGFFGENTEGS